MVEEAERLGGFTFFSSDFDCFEFWSPDSFRHELPRPPGPYGGRIHLVLFQNPSASVTDPISPLFFDSLERWVEKERLRCKIHRTPALRAAPSPFRFQTQVFPRCAISLFSSLSPPCPKQLLELPVSKEVKDFLLTVTPLDPTPLFGGFLPLPLNGS